MTDKWLVKIEVLLTIHFMLKIDGFDLSMALGEAVDMSDVFGMTMPKGPPLEVLITVISHL